MSLRCVVLDDYAEAAAGLADWSSLGDVELSVFSRHLGSEDELVAHVADADVIVTLRERVAFPASVLERLPRLRLLVASGMRNTVIDYAAARRGGVTVCGTSSSGTPPVELTWALILGLVRDLVPESNAVRAGGWQSALGGDLHGRRLGLLGLGKIGTKVARVGLAFGMDVVAWSRSMTPERAADAGVAMARTKEEVLSTSDVVSVHLAFAEGSRGLIGAPELALMRPDAYLVNTSRAAIIDQDALLEALREGRIAGAGVDVFDVEPLPPGHPMRSAPRLLATPHLGYVTRGNLERYYREAVEDIAAFLAGDPVRVLGDSG